jgi:hypothetical protein
MWSWVTGKGVEIKLFDYCGGMEEDELYLGLLQIRGPHKGKIIVYKRGIRSSPVGKIHLYHSLVFQKLNNLFNVCSELKPLFMKPCSTPVSVGIPLAPALCQKVWATFEIGCESIAMECERLLLPHKIVPLTRDYFPWYI